MMREIFLTILIFAITSSGGYFYGKSVEKQAQQVEIERLNKEARAKEEALTSAVNTTANVLRSTNERAKLAIEKRNADIIAGNIRLRVPVKGPDCPVQIAGDTTPAAGNSVQATAELDPAVAQRIVAITDQGDANTRQLNACIDAYNSIYQTLKGKP